MFWRSSDEVDDHDDDVHYDQPGDDYVVASSPAPREKKERKATENEEEATNPWTTALHDTCTSLGSLHATPEQVMKKSVLESTQSFDRPKKSQVTLWSSKDQLVPAMVESYRQREEDQAAAAASSWWLSRVASKVYSTVASSKGVVDDVDDWTEPGEDYMASDLEVPWQEPVVDIDLAVKCCQTIVAKAKSTDRQAIVLYREGTTEHCFMGWVRQVEQESALSGEQDEDESEEQEEQQQSAPPSPAQLLLSKLPDDQIQFLLKLLMRLNLLRMVDEDVLVVGAMEEEDAVSVALFRLDVAMHQIETRIHNWTEQRDAALQQAMKLNKKKNSKALVLTQLRRKQLYDNSIQLAHGTLLNLHQTRLGVETAQSQARVTQVLSETAIALQQMSNDNGLTVELVDDLKDDLLEEYDHLQTVHDSLTQQQQQQSDGGDDASLLSELEKLMIADDINPSAPPPSGMEESAGLPLKDEGDENKGKDPSPPNKVACTSPPVH
jgi:hypothetical protein